MTSWFWKSAEKWRCSLSYAADLPHSSINLEIDALANFERSLPGRFSFDSQKQNMLV